MKMTKTLTLLGMFVLVVSIAGCMGTGSGDTTTSMPGDGVVITNIKTDYDTIEAEEKMTLAVDFENRGEKTAEDITGEIIRKGSFQIDPVYVEATSSLEPPIEDTYSSDEFIWDIRAPDVSEERIEEIQARIHYNYTTEAFATIHFVPRDILREKGEASFQTDASSSNGPLKINIVSNQPAVIRDDDLSSCFGYDFECIDISEGETCQYLGCDWEPATANSPEQCTGTADDDLHCENLEEEGHCKAVDGGAVGENTCNWGPVKDIRMTILVENMGGGQVENETEEGEFVEDYIKKLTIEAFGGPSCALDEELDNIHVIKDGSNQLTLRNMKLVRGEEARKTITNRFPIYDTGAATSCQLKVTAEYGYRTDSSILSIGVEPKI